MSDRANWGSMFWRVVYFLAGLILLIAGRRWMSDTDDATMMPFVLMMLGVVLITIAVRMWPGRRN